MAIDGEGRIQRAHQDSCKNYTPDKERSTGVKSVKLGMIYECKKYDVGANIDQGCYWCINKEAIEMKDEPTTLHILNGTCNDEIEIEEEALIKIEDLPREVRLEILKLRKDNVALKHLCSKLIDDLQVRVLDRADSNLPEWERAFKALL